MSSWERYKSLTTGFEVVNVELGKIADFRSFCDDSDIGPIGVYVAKAPVCKLSLVPTVQFPAVNIAWDISDSMSATSTIATFDISWGGATDIGDLSAQSWSGDPLSGNVQYDSEGTYTVQASVTDLLGEQSKTVKVTVNIVEFVNSQTRAYIGTTDAGIFIDQPASEPTASNSGLSSGHLNFRAMRLNPVYKPLPTDQHHIFVATEDGIGYSFDGAAAWSVIAKAALGVPANDAGDSPAPATADLDQIDIAFDPLDPYHIIMLRTIADRAWIYESFDYGATWQNSQIGSAWAALFVPILISDTRTVNEVGLGNFGDTAGLVAFGAAVADDDSTEITMLDGSLGSFAEYGDGIDNTAKPLISFVTSGVVLLTFINTSSGGIFGRLIADGPVYGDLYSLAGSAGSTIHFQVILSASRAVIMDRDGDDANLLDLNTATREITVLDTANISFGVNGVFGTTQIDSDEFIIVEENSTPAEAKIVSISGDTLAVTSTSTLTGVNIGVHKNPFTMATISSTRFVLVYRESNIKAVVISKSGSTLSANTIVDFGVGTAVYSSFELVDFDDGMNFGVVYGDASETFFRSFSVDDVTITDNDDETQISATLGFDEGSTVHFLGMVGIAMRNTGDEVYYTVLTQLYDLTHSSGGIPGAIT